MKFEPHDYQRRAIKWIIDHPRALLFLDMGLGKTVSTLTAIAKLQCYGEAMKVLVVAPKLVAETTWSTEAAKWQHLQDLRVVSVMGTLDKRRKALKEKGDIYVTSRDNIAWLTEQYNTHYTLKKKPAWPFDMLVIDELTSFKHHGSVRSKAIQRGGKLTHRIVGLTGTPAPNGLIDLWAQVYAIDGGERLFKSITQFRTRWFETTLMNNIPIKVTPHPGAQEEIMARIADIALSMRAEDYLKMPPITYTDIEIDMGDELQGQYDRFAKQKVLEMGDAELTASSAATLLSKLSQYANGFVYYEQEVKGKQENKAKFIHNLKTKALDELEELVKEPMLVFYQFAYDKTRLLYYFGRCSLRVRVYQTARDLEDWNAGKIDILLAHPSSTAYGLNMQKGGAVIVWYSTGWNLELYQQANARLYRQGQTKPVRVFNLITKGTVDERMVAAIKGKEANQTAIMKRLAKEVIKSTQQ